LPQSCSRVIFETSTLGCLCSCPRHLQPALVVAIPHTFCPVLCCCCSCLLQLSPACLFSEGIASAVRPH
jgi:hypothetical protein